MKRCSDGREGHQETVYPGTQRGETMEPREEMQLRGELRKPVIC